MPIAPGRFRAEGATAHVLIEVERGASASLTIRRASAVSAGTPEQNSSEETRRTSSDADCDLQVATRSVSPTPAEESHAQSRVLRR